MIAYSDYTITFPLSFVKTRKRIEPKNGVFKNANLPSKKRKTKPNKKQPQKYISNFCARNLKSIFHELK